MKLKGRNSPTAPRRVIAAERRLKAVELRRAGKKLSEIGAELGVTAQAAGKMVRKQLDELAKETIESADALRAMESERLAEVAAVLRPMALEGDINAAKEYRNYSESYRKLWGLDLRPDADGGGVNIQVITTAPWERGPGEPGYTPPTIDGQVVEPAALEAGPPPEPTPPVTPAPQPGGQEDEADPFADDPLRHPGLPGPPEQ